jgi:hypothetical protein
MKRRGSVLAGLAVVCALWGGSTFAYTIEIELTGSVTGVDDPGNLLAGAINVDDIMSGIYRYDSETPDTNPVQTAGAYSHKTSPYGMYLTVEGLVFQSDPGNVDFGIGIQDGTYGHDTYLLRSYNNLPLPNGVAIEHISWQLDDYAGLALTSDALLLTAPILSEWPGTWAHLKINLGQQSSGLVIVEVTSARLVPEPATVLLLGLGAIVLLRTRRRF